METGGIVKPDSPLALELGFTSDRFDGWLWRTQEGITISFIMCKQPGKGHFSALLDAIWDRGWSIAVPTPLGAMRNILKAKGFVPTWVYDEDFADSVELWVCPPPKR